VLGGAFAPVRHAAPAWAALPAAPDVEVVAAAWADVCAAGSDDADDDEDDDDEDDEPQPASASAPAAATAAMIDGRTGRVCQARRQARVSSRRVGTGARRPLG
jgi:hypothetical protein